MQRSLLLLVFCISFSTSVLAQLTELAANKNFDLEVPLSKTKALLVEAGGAKLWVTDATTGGTFKLSDTLLYTTGDAGGLLNGKFIFAASSPYYGNELWITDGTIAGTQLVKDIIPGATGSEPSDDFALLNGFLYFSANADGVGRELWRTNGTEAGTTMVGDLTPGLGASALKGRFDIVSTGTYLLFKVTSLTTGYELWRSDGTAAGSSLLKDIYPGFTSSEATGFHSHNNKVLFWAVTPTEGRELWQTDGTAAGTQLLIDIRTGAESSVNASIPVPVISFFYPFNNRLLFMANDGVTGDEIWSTDGTAAGTFLLKDINPGTDLSYISLANAIPMNGKLYFAAYQQGSGSELWETDGTQAGTKIFKEILAGVDGGIPMLLPNFTFDGTTAWPVHQGSMFYFFFGLPAEAGVELWKSDGTDAGTVKVKTVRTEDSDVSNLSYIYTTAGLYFTNDDGVLGDELWKSNGTEAGTIPVIDLNAGPGDSEISIFPIAVNNRILLTGNNGDGLLSDLYRLDGDMAPLPVKLESFTVSLVGNEGHLRWQTASEENSLEFVIERSEDGKLFSRIGAVPAAGSASGRRSYSYNDAAPGNSGKAVVYYRLLLKDRDGKQAYSKILTLNLRTTESFQMQLLGNPVQSEIRVMLNNAVAPVILSITDAAGRTVKSPVTKTQSGVVTLPATGLLPGVYFLRAESNGKSSLVKFMKQ